MSHENYLEQLSPCPECGSGDYIQWCGPSVRPYCGDCGHWGAVNHHPNGPDVAIANWNNHYAKNLQKWKREDQYPLLDKYSKELGVDITIKDLIEFHRNHRNLY